MSSTTTPGGSLLGVRDWQRLRSWYRHHGRHHLPWRKNRSPWRILVAETLLHRTRADTVAALYPAIIGEFSSPGAVLDQPERWHAMTKPAGLVWRSEAFIRSCTELVLRHEGQVPIIPEGLLALPGVGHYVAAAVRCFGFGEPAILVDTNTIRLTGRVAGMDLDPSRHRTRAVRGAVARLRPDGRLPDADDNFALLDLAALVCTPRAPQCIVCPLREGCVTGHARTTTGEGRQPEDG